MIPKRTPIKTACHHMNVHCAVQVPVWYMTYATSPPLSSSQLPLSVMCLKFSSAGDRKGVLFRHLLFDVFPVFQLPPATYLTTVHVLQCVWLVSFSPRDRSQLLCLHGSIRHTQRLPHHTLGLRACMLATGCDSACTCSTPTWCPPPYDNGGVRVLASLEVSSVHRARSHVVPLQVPSAHLPSCMSLCSSRALRRCPCSFQSSIFVHVA